MRTISFYAYRMILLGLTMLALALILANQNVWAVDPAKEPAILVANKKLSGLYSKTVLLVVPVGNESHIGFILNRPTKTLLFDLFPEHEPSKKVTDPVYLGGPVRSDVVFAIVKTPNPGNGSFPLMSDVWFVTKADTVDRVIEERGNNALYIAGFVIWKPGELAEEMRQELWHVEDPDAELIFKKDTTELWKELEKKHRVRGLST